MAAVHFSKKSMSPTPPKTLRVLVGNGAWEQIMEPMTDVWGDAHETNITVNLKGMEAVGSGGPRGCRLSPEASCL